MGKHEQTMREMDVAVAERVMGWTFAGADPGIPKHVATFCWIPPGKQRYQAEQLPYYTMNPVADNSVLDRVLVTYSEGQLREFGAALNEMWRDRLSSLPLGSTVRNCGMMHLMYLAGDYSHAAIVALGATT